MNVVIDTNIFISGFFWKGTPNKILDLWRQGIIQNIISDLIIEEVRSVLNNKFINAPDILREEIIGIILSNSVMVYPKQKYDLVRDVSDNKFIEAAVEGRATYIISGDRDLLSISRVHNIAIVSPSEFLKNYKT